MSQNGVAEPILYRPKELIDLLQLSRSQVYLLLASGQIRSIKIGRLRRIHRRDLDEWLSRSQGAA